MRKNRLIIMSQICSEFTVGELYSNEEVYKALGIGNAGGLRFRIVEDCVTRAALFTSVPLARKKSENPYHDRIENGILTYTAAGREGDQTLAGMNKRLSDQATLNFPIHGFIIIANRKDKSFGPKRWQYLGLLEYVRHFPDAQIDARGLLRNVWIFEFRVHSSPRAVPLTHDAMIARELLERSRRENPLNEDDLSLAAHPRSEQIISKVDPMRIEAVRGKLLTVTPKRFEHLLKDLLSMTGFTMIEVTKYSAGWRH
jgi:hypothetical protein